MMTNYKVSVLMPSLNVANYIDQCISSVVNQTLKDIQIICIDAGSTDGTLEILEKHANTDDRITIVHSDKRSYGYQLNLGIDAAKGEYIGIVETDDIAEPDMFEVLYNTVHGKDIDYIKGNAVQFYERAGSIHKILQYTPYVGLRDIKEEYLEVNPSSDPTIFLSDNFLWNGIYRADFFKSIRFQETFGAAFQDISVLFRIISTAHKARYVNRSVYLYRQDNFAASSYNSKSIIYTNGEYYHIIEEFLQGLSGGWVKICYKKMVLLTLNRFYEMASSGIFWRVSENGIEGLRAKLRYALDKRILCKEDFTDVQWARVHMLLENPRELFQYDYEYYMNKVRYIHSIREAIGNSEYIIFGCGQWGTYLADILQIHYGLTPRAFWDNASSKWGTKEKGIYTEMPCNLKDSSIKYVIANKRCVQDIKKQLNGLEVRPDQIIEFSIEWIDIRLYRSRECFNQIKGYNKGK
ncbi:MAG: hypothetical protein PWP24_216 [Clostridiales bacterium]|nr:hypothetical protein [Clostridiales bacterium]